MEPQDLVDLQVRRYMEGYAQCLRDLENDWHAVANPAARNLETYAELEKRRWGPNGRAHFGDPRPGDRTGLRIVRGRAA